MKEDGYFNKCGKRSYAPARNLFPRKYIEHLFSSVLLQSEMANCLFSQYVKSFREKFAFKNEISGGECWTVVRRKKPGETTMKISRDRSQNELK